MVPYTSRRAITVARLIYFIISILSGVVLSYIATNGRFSSNADSSFAWIGVLAGALVASVFIYIETLTKGFTIKGFTTATVGLCIGLFCAWLLSSVKLPELIIAAFKLQDLKVQFDFNTIKYGFNIILFSSLGFIGTALALRSNQDDFAVLIPFVRFRQENNKGRPVTCSLDVLIDGRIIQLIHSGFVNTQIVIPSFIMNKLQTLKNSEITTESLQGKRGLETIENLRNSPGISISMHNFDTQQKGESPENLTLLTCRQLSTRLLTSDNNLTQLAHLQEIPVLNLKQLAEAMKPNVEIGQSMHLAIVRTGKEEHQGVGYLPDGTMIVVNNAFKLIGSTQDITVISTIQTSAGLMVFAELNGMTA